MPNDSTGQPTRRAVVSFAILAVLVVVALLPNSGAIPADTSCSYGSCPAQNNSPATLWYVLLGVLVLVAAALAVLLVLRRRRSPGVPPAVEAWSGPTQGPEAGADLAPAAAAAPMPSYLESPEDVGQPMPEVAPAPAPEPPSDSGDIDSLMKELDKISGEILQRGRPKTPGPTTGDEAESPETSEGADDTKDQ